MVGGPRASYLLDFFTQDLHVSSRLRVAEVDRPLEVLSGTAPTRRLAKPFVSHGPQTDAGIRIVLSCGLPVPHQRLLVVQRVDSVALHREHVAELILADGIAPLSADLVRRQRPRIVDRRALAPDVDATDEPSSLDVALRGGCRTNE